MTKNKLIRALILCAAAALLILAVSCSSVKYDAEEIRGVLEGLIASSEPLNVIYFGEGLPPTEDEAEISAFYGAFAANVKYLNYLPVTRDCGYGSIADIKEATEEVFTPEYSEYLYELAFTGISGDNVPSGEDEKADGEGEDSSENGKVGEGEEIKSGSADEWSGGMSGQGVLRLDVTASYARYIEQNGRLTVRLDLADEAYRLGREYALEEMKIASADKTSVTCVIPTYMDGEYSCDVKLRLVMTGSGWRLDSPTY